MIPDGEEQIAKIGRIERWLFPDVTVRKTQEQIADDPFILWCSYERV